MELKFFKKNSFPESDSGNILFNSDTHKIYLKEDSGWICYSSDPIPTIVLQDYIGYGTDFGEAQTVTLDSSKFFIIGRCSSLTLTLPANSSLDCLEYRCQFYVPNSSFTLTLPTGCAYQEGIAPEFNENECYQLVIVNNCVTWGKFSGTSTEEIDSLNLGSVSNSGTSHLIQLNDNHGLSSGTYTLKYIDSSNNPLDSFRDISTFTI